MKVTAPMRRALEVLAEGPAVRSNRTVAPRRVYFQTAVRLVDEGLATEGSDGGFRITDAGRECLR